MTTIEPTADPRGVSRRAVVRTVGHTAWVAPVIVAATAAPSYAASGPAALSITISQVDDFRLPFESPRVMGNYGIKALSTITNANTQMSTGARITLTVTMNNSGSWGGLTAVQMAEAPGWVTTAPTRSDEDSIGGFRTRTWVFNAVGEVPANGTKPFDVEIDTGQDAVVIRGVLSIVVEPGLQGTGGNDSESFGPPVP